MARRQMNIVDLQAWLDTTGAGLRGLHVSNIYYDREAGILLVKFRGGRLLVAEPGRRIHLTTRMEPPKEFKPDPLVVLARKHVRGSRLVDIRLVGGDRIVEMVFSTGYRLIVELVPRGVGALVDESGTLLAATQYLRVRDRTLRPKAPYKPPPARESRLPPSPGEVLEALRGEERLVPPLVRKLGIPAEVAEEALHRAGLPREGGSVGPVEAEAIVEAIAQILSEARQGRGYLAHVDGSPVEASPFKPTHYLEEGGSLEEKPGLDEALDELFTSKPEARAKTVGEAEAERQRLLASLQRAEETARAYLAKAGELRRAADYVARNYDLFQRLAECMARYRRPDDIEGCSGIPVAAVDDKGVVVEVEGLRIRVPWSQAPPDKLITHLFREAGQYEAKARRAESVRRDVEERLRELEVKARARRIAEAYNRRRRYWFEKFHWTITRGGLLVVGGRDASQNELLVRRYLGERDIFMHADIHGAPAVLVKDAGPEPGEEDLQDAATIAVAYSKAWKAGVGAVRVFYVPASQVSLSPPSGEYLAKGGIMVYGRKRYLPPTPVKISVGIAIDEEGIPRILAGSEEVVSRHAIAYFNVVPGDESRIDAASRAKREMARLAGDQAPLILAVPDQDIAQRIPGKARITTVRRGRGEILKLSTRA